MSPEEQPAKPWEKKEESNDLETVRKFSPVVLFDGQCEHEWNYAMARLDNDGMYNIPCAKCPMGNLVKPEDMPK